MPGVQSSAAPEIMQRPPRLSSPDEISRIDILEHESVSGGAGGDETPISSTLFDMFASSQFSNNAANNSSSSSSLHEKAIFPEISAFPEQGTTAAAAAAGGGGAGDGGGGGIPAAGASSRTPEDEHPGNGGGGGFGSFQFLSRSMFAERSDKAEELEQQGLTLQQASPSSVEIEAPGITKLWTDYDEDGGEQHHASFHSLGDINGKKNTTTASFQANSSWGGASRSSSVLEATTTRTSNKPKRKRSRPCKSSEEVESQRMTHIAVERNRRRQMNEHLRVLRALMPGSYVQRGDQASIIGGAIEFVKELQQLLQCLEEQKKRKMSFVEAPPRMLGSPTTIIQAVAAGFPGGGGGMIRASPPAPPPPPPLPLDVKYFDTGLYEPLRELYGEAKSEIAQVEVKITGSNANIKILSQKKPGQLLKTMTALENKLLFSILHTNVTTIDHTVLYAFEVKIGQNCELANEIAEFIHETLASSL
ncbi:uncharacterized protein LOC9633501 [Selaginella moellendorffii]|uniref:uncharacterized protein LOC9633501 n=1 Tax=Selaginella moellendorffii TaxID=88036 RepID=UPI000D1C3CCC|nr:uncharacterized protein LOC9633501 [Selaginella moellendorffii]XP_024531482.1 uncharacterized protein LOC9633501 [Selaginella moellendorffii]|eukprot:XP_024531481.1 uncharacterized protein LOC9633501 [Selaginella moellendorffii]